MPLLAMLSSQASPATAKAISVRVQGNAQVHSRIDYAHLDCGGDGEFSRLSLPLGPLQLGLHCLIVGICQSQMLVNSSRGLHPESTLLCRATNSR